MQAKQPFPYLSKIYTTRHLSWVLH